MPEIKSDVEGKPIPDGNVDIYYRDGTTETYEFADIKSHGPDGDGWIIRGYQCITSIPASSIKKVDTYVNSEDYQIALAMFQETHDHTWEKIPTLAPCTVLKYCNGCEKHEEDHTNHRDLDTGIDGGE